MRWTRLLRRHKHEPPEPAPTPGQQAADNALNRARRARRDAESKTGAVTEAAESLRQVRERNHFGSMILKALEGDH
ncbi:hypothetical protein ABZ404_38645 [Streptomyces sp. NPDC005878]|uniref:DUF7620 family protein n=1 Tax=Streptomyces sp. NPDC005878 TaxID=3157077 RepID=UPI0033F71578